MPNANSQKMHLVRMYLPLLQMPTTFEHTKILHTTFDKNPYHKGCKFTEVVSVTRGMASGHKRKAGAWPVGSHIEAICRVTETAFVNGVCAYVRPGVLRTRVRLAASGTIRCILLCEP